MYEVDPLECKYGGLFRSVTYIATTVELQNLLTFEEGADGSQKNDITDFNSLASNFDPDGATAPHSWLEGNFNGDGDIDITDFNLLESNFMPGGVGTWVIPEPSTMLLASLTLVQTSGGGQFESLSRPSRC